MLKKISNAFYSFSTSLWAILFFVVLFFTSCSTPKVYPEHPLVDKILTARPGFEYNLVNSTCHKYDKKKCVKWSHRQYDLSDEKIVKNLHAFKFICKLGMKTYTPCKNGFCRYEYKRDWFLAPKKPVLEHFVPIKDYEFVLAAKTRCYNKDVYDF